MNWDLVNNDIGCTGFTIAFGKKTHCEQRHDEDSVVKRYVTYHIRPVI